MYVDGWGHTVARSLVPGAPSGASHVFSRRRPAALSVNPASGNKLSGGNASEGRSDGGALTESPIFQLFRAYGPWFLGLCCCNVWIGWMNGEHGLRPNSAWDMLCAAVMTLTLLVALAWGLLHPCSVKATYLADWPIALLMAMFTLSATGLIPGEPTWLLVASTALTEIGMAWLYIRWGVFLSKLDIRSTVGCIFAAHVVGCSAKLCLYYVPAWGAVSFVSLLPLISMTLLSIVCRRVSWAEGDGPLTSDAALSLPAQIWCSNLCGASGPLWKAAAFVACYRLFFYFVPTAGSATSNMSLSTICCVAEILVALLILYMLLVRGGSFTFQQVWSIFLLLLGIALVCMTTRASSPIGSSVCSAAGSLLVMFTWLVFANIAHHSTLHPFVVFGIARIAYEVPRLVAQATMLFVPKPAGDDALYTAALLFALLVFAVLFFDWRDPTLALIFSDFQQHRFADAAQDLTSLCEQTARQHDLTQREAQVLLYLCQGRTRAYIAETLYLSENTVRGHTQRIYAKLGVHNKTELQRKLGV